MIDNYFKAMGVVALSLAALVASARTFEFKAVGTKADSSITDSYYGTTEKNRSAMFQIRVGPAGKVDDNSKMEIRAATIFKNAATRKTGVNDVATLSFDPINNVKQISFMVSTGTARLKRNYSGDAGWQVAGVIIEIWQSGKAVKHWTNVPGNGGKTKLTEDVEQLFIWSDGNDRKYHSGEFDNATTIFPINQKGEKVDLETLIKESSKQEEPDKAESAAGQNVADKEPGDKEKNEAEAKKSDDELAGGEFVLKSFCGFEFGSKRPAFSDSNSDRVVTLRKPFRHYTQARLEYGENSGELLRITLTSSQRFASDQERAKAAATAAAVIEKKFGITLRDYFDSGFRFSDGRHTIMVFATSITVTRSDLLAKESALRKSLREETQRKIKSSNDSDDGLDVL